MPKAVNHVIYDGSPLIDLRSDTVTDPSHIMAGYVGHLADGSVVTGTGQGGGGVSRDTIVAEQTVTVSEYFTALTGSEGLVEGEVYSYTVDGTEYIGMAVPNSGMLYVNSGFAYAIGDYGGNLYLVTQSTGQHTVTVEKLDLSGSGGGGTNQDYEDALVAFGVQSNLASGITALTTYANEITGESDTNLSDAVRSLADGYGQGGSAVPPWVSSVETVTIGANTVANTNQVKSYFSGKTPYFAVVLKSAPTTNNQIVAMVNNAASALRYRNGAVGTAGVSTAYDAKLIEGTQYDIYHF